MESNIDLSQITAQLHILRSRVLELEQTISGMKTIGPTLPAVPLSPAMWTAQRFWALITTDNYDGTYQVKRLIAAARNTLIDDPDNPAAVTVGNIPERTGYNGMYSVNDVVSVVFDGLDATGAAIYHIA